MHYPQTFSVKSSTSTLTNHARKHGFMNFFTSQASFAYNGSVQVTLKTPRRENHERINKNILQWIVMNSLPFSVIESEEFKRMVSAFDEDFTIPYRRTITRRLHTEFDFMSTRVTEYFKQFDSSASLTCDAWSSKICRGYIVVSAYLVDEHWTMKKALVHSSLFPTPHKRDSTCQILIERL